MPIGEARHQRLVRVRRVGPGAFEQEAAGAVSFVPLIGDHGWSAGDA